MAAYGPGPGGPRSAAPAAAGTSEPKSRVPTRGEVSAMGGREGRDEARGAAVGGCGARGKEGGGSAAVSRVRDFGGFNGKEWGKGGRKNEEEKEGEIVPRRGRRASSPMSAKRMEMSSPVPGQGRIGAK